MSDLAIKAALEVRLATITPALATAQENGNYVPVIGTPYQRVNFLPAEPENPSIGASLYREQGIFQVTLLYPTNAGAVPARTRAQLIRSAFPRGMTLSSGGVTVHIDRTPTIERGTTEADRYAVVVRIRYHANIFT